MTDLQDMVSSLARIEAQGRATHHRLDDLRGDLIRHTEHDDERFGDITEQITKARVKQGWMIGVGVGGIAIITWIKDHLTF